MNTFDEQREGTGTHEWAEVTENISRGCPHDCLYCYAAQNAKRFKLRDRADWKREELTKRAYITSYPARGGVIMFPSVIWGWVTQLFTPIFCPYRPATRFFCTFNCHL